MFSKTDGPTALRADLVRALSFSRDPIERRSAAATLSSVAALAAVWNGRKGHVALILRDVEPATIERYVSSVPIASESDLEAAVEEGLAFAESLGFSMDAPDFEILSAEEREARIHRWNKLRKVREAVSAAAREEESSPSVPEVDVPDLQRAPTGYEIELEDLAVASPPPALDFERELFARVPAGDSSRESVSRAQNARSTVLGRVSLIRKSGADARRLELLARLLASY